MDPHIDTLVLTSEDPDVIKDITTNQAMLDKGWKFVLNVRDVKQGTGSASALVHEASNQGKKVRIADVMESGLCHDDQDKSFSRLYCNLCTPLCYVHGFCSSLDLSPPTAPHSLLACHAKVLVAAAHCPYAQVRQLHLRHRAQAALH